MRNRHLSRTGSASIEIKTTIFFSIVEDPGLKKMSYKVKYKINLQKMINNEH